jgi:anti-anti-sigma factor
MQTGTPTSRESALRVSVAPSSADQSVFIVRVDGQIDTLTADELDRVIGTLVRQKRTRLVVDLAGAQYISSAGWGIFISRLRETREDGGDLKLARMTAPVRDVYDLLELDGVLAHFDRLDMAETHFNGGNGGHQSAPPRIRAIADSQGTTVTSSLATASLEDALRQLILEDPFYTVGEMRERLTETGHSAHGRWAILRALWSLALVFRHQRFRYYRRQMHGPRHHR